MKAEDNFLSSAFIQYVFTLPIDDTHKNRPVNWDVYICVTVPSVVEYENSVNYTNPLEFEYTYYNSKDLFYNNEINIVRNDYKITEIDVSEINI